MNKRRDIIESTIRSIPFVQDLFDFEQRNLCIYGKVNILFDGMDRTLCFIFIVTPSYPFKNHDSESICFINKDLIEYSHVMESGNICIHTRHSSVLEEKLMIDFTSLKNWIVKYYISTENDSKYEHIVATPSIVDDIYRAFCFAECDQYFSKGEFGNVDIISLNGGLYKDKVIHNYLAQRFISISGNINESKLSDFYLRRDKTLNGLYYFLGDTPALYGKFAYENYAELANLMSDEFLDIMHQYEIDSKAKHSGSVVPLFLGYKISPNDIHWQVALLKIGEFPLKGEVVRNNGVKTGKWKSVLIENKIEWAITKDISYKYFFGRGVFSEKLTTKKILFVGVGALGSIIAETLTRCGCLHLDFIDYDTKDPENICRSEYIFSNGIQNKTCELKQILSEISPFVNCMDLYINNLDALLKAAYQDNSQRADINCFFEKYDIVIDCSTDNDLMYILDSLKLKCDLINLSITNHAKELVCAFSPNIYDFVITQFTTVLNNDTQDLYEPTGCWNPTFKASYNDINTLVQFALKHINRIYDNELPKNNFVVRSLGNMLKIDEF